MRAFLLIDIQNDFLPGGSLAVPDGDKVIPLVNQLQPGFDLVVATQDWHPQNHKSFASNHTNKNAFDVIDLNGIQQVLWPDHCVQNTPGADLSEELQTELIRTIIRKGTNPEIDSYSGFYDNGHLQTTGLADFLREHEVQEIYIAGLAGDYCVYFTAIDALEAGFNTYLIEDACRPLSPENFELAKQEIIAKGGKIIQSQDIITTTPTKV
ncbi:bifunctional nicotinamidase/pyrazinamidase [Pontibacter arcticus]|uniref:Nicotinamidase n=1 Tax=Pontibacter arcticus TaxID=2080288 RepID=A0A364RG14_9BACT|nr:bifunctional nicotinamidase/pyrazinamidase [Pontibacter arcticus]RAU83241.1 bifunctional nicotinamidase/pyrazinamidase [Pontibacter arcticus]